MDRESTDTKISLPGGRLKLIVDGTRVDFQEQIVIVSNDITGPVDGLTNDELFITITPDGNVLYDVRSRNTVSTTGVRTSHGTPTTMQALATAANTPG